MWPSWLSWSSQGSDARLKSDLEKGTNPSGPEFTITIESLQLDSKQPDVAPPVPTAAPETVGDSVAINLGGSHNRMPDSFFDTAGAPPTTDASMPQDEDGMNVRKRGLVDGKKNDLVFDVSLSTDEDAILELLEKVSNHVAGKHHLHAEFQENHHPTTLATVTKTSTTSSSVNVPTTDVEKKPSQEDWL
ncbi:hypothetical protein HOO65_050607 [Ceratocystis lukuohia]|uniref:Uncharacterized protein n=1 Tax=Ceratocystis lukuohia TaxID=2019550 RepID=A0ABR4MGT9_9PEZI